MRNMEIDNILEYIEEEKLKESKLNFEQIQSLKYEIMGRVMAEEVNIFNAYTGSVETTRLFDAIVRTVALRYIRFITPESQPLFNIRNEYMGFISNGKVKNLKKEKESLRNKQRILTFLTGTGAFVVGLTAPIISTIAFIVAIMAFGGMTYISMKELI